MTHLTANELAQAIVQTEWSTNTERVKLLSRRVRQYQSERWIDATGDPRDDRGTHQYDGRNCAKAVLLSSLVDIGLDKSKLSDAVYWLGQPARLNAPFPEWMQKDGYIQVPSALNCIIEGANQGESWFLWVTTRICEGKRTQFVTVANSVPSQEDFENARLLDAEQGHLIGITVLPASNLISHLVGSL